MHAAITTGKTVVLNRTEDISLQERCGPGLLEPSAPLRTFLAPSGETCQDGAVRTLFRSRRRDRALDLERSVSSWRLEEPLMASSATHPASQHPRVLLVLARRSCMSSLYRSRETGGDREDRAAVGRRERKPGVGRHRGRALPGARDGRSFCASGSCALGIIYQSLSKPMMR